MGNSPFINSVYINLKYHTVVRECFGNLKIRERSSMSNKFPSRSFLLSYWNDNVLQLGLYIFFTVTKERSSEDK